LKFDIEKDGVEKLVEFLPNMEFTDLEFPHKNKG
jgi:hypothetical protein